MKTFKNKRRIKCVDSNGGVHVVLEQILAASNEPPVTDYLTERGDVVSRLDDRTFLLLVDRQTVFVSKSRSL